MTRLMHKIGSLTVFTGHFLQFFSKRVESNGWRSAMKYAKCCWIDFYIELRERRMTKPRVECPCCGWTGYDFRGMDGIFFYLPSVHCPQCNGCERHRMLHLYIRRHDPELFNRAGWIIHFAPAREGNLRGLMEESGQLKIFATDYNPDVVRHLPQPKHCGDIQQQPLKNGCFDLLFCMHVLEHVPEDKQAIHELWRILKPGGVAYIMVPYEPGTTESYALPEPDPMTHIWMYAVKDFKDRLEGFDVKEIHPKDFMSAQELDRYKVPPKEVIYRCVKVE